MGEAATVALDVLTAAGVLLVSVQVFRLTGRVDALDKRVAKMEHLKQETERIAAKEIDGLSAGQTAQVERNTKRLQELGEQVDSRSRSLTSAGSTISANTAELEFLKKQREELREELQVEGSRKRCIVM